jgi:hypothetical protein
MGRVAPPAAAARPSTGGYSMNFRTLATFVIVLGIAFLAYGGFQYVTNQPVKFDPSKSESFLGGRNDIGNFLNVQGQNMTREVRRQGAKKNLMIGAVITFVGIAVFASARPAPAVE